MKDTDINNSLAGVEIGSTTDSILEGFNATVIVKPITKVAHRTQSRVVMTGTSRYVYSKTMNRGSLGISGSYGFSPVSKVTGAVFGYVGQAKADDHRETRVDYHNILQAGIEYINFDGLVPSQLIGALAGSIKEKAIKALDAYNALCEEDIEEAERLSLLKDWTKARTSFYEAAGTGVVVGVYWGAIGSVSMTIKQDTSSQDWQYGGKGNFSYVGTGASVSVEATYDGSNASTEANATFEVRQYCCGSVLSDPVNQWFIDLSNKSWADLAKMKAVESPKFPNLELKVPKIPPFSEIVPDPVIAKKLKDIKNLNKLDKLTKDAQYQIANEKSPNLSREDFDKTINQTSDTQKLSELEASIKDDDLPGTIEWEDFLVINPEFLVTEIRDIGENEAGVYDLPVDADSSRIPVDLLTLSNSEINDVPTPGMNDGTYTPLGVWIANWADLFPWLSTSSFNSIDSLADAEDLLHFRMVVQDFDALRKIYYSAHDTELKVESNNVLINFLNIADSFSQQMGILSENQNFSKAAVNQAISGLSVTAKNIYKKWVEVGFLRDCELGLGVVFSSQTSPENFSSPTFEHAYPTRHTPIIDAIFRNNFFYLENIDFSSSNRTYSAFATFMKFMPLILPSGNIRLFACNPKYKVAGLLTVGSGSHEDGVHENLIGDHPGCYTIDPTALENTPFKDAPESDNSVSVIPNPEERVLIHDANGLTIQAFPIPFKAAQGVQKWVGQSLSTNIGSFQDLLDNLNGLHKQLKNCKTWTFSSENWPVDWKGDQFYVLKQIPTQYIGIESDDNNNIFS